MEVDAFLADSAELVQGKIYALGIGWNLIWTRQFPVVHPRVALGITVHVPYTATNQMHRVEIRLEDEDGNARQIGMAPGPDGAPQPTTKLEAQFNIGRPPLLPPGDEQIAPLAVQFDQLQFDHAGAYSWVISVDGTEARRLPMRVSLIQQGMPI